MIVGIVMGVILGLSFGIPWGYSMRRNEVEKKEE